MDQDRFERELDEAALKVRESLGTADVALVLGSGLGKFAQVLQNPKILNYADIPHMPRPSIAGHSGQLLCGTVSNNEEANSKTKIFCFSGRVHAYEGIPFHEICFQVKLMAKLGCKIFVLTNAAGGCGAGMYPGCIMLMTDHIRFTKANPLAEVAHLSIVHDPLLRSSNLYSPRLINLARNVAKKHNIDLFEGTYCVATGPSYESNIEVLSGYHYGASAFGMSTVPEALVAASCGIEVVAMSMVTNLAAGFSPNELSHGEVMETANKWGPMFVKLMQMFLSDENILSNPQPLVQDTRSEIVPPNPVRHGFELNEQILADAARFVEDRLGKADGIAVLVCRGHDDVLKSEIEISPLGQIPGFSSLGLTHHNTGKMGLGLVDTPSGSRRVYVVHSGDVDGFGIEEATFLALLLQRCGCKIAIFSMIAAPSNPQKRNSTTENGSGGEVCFVDGLINMTPFNPLSLVQQIGNQNHAFDEETMLVPQRVSQFVNSALNTRNNRSYASFVGPSFPSEAEMRMCDGIGAELVGTTSIAIVYALRYLGVDVVPFATVPLLEGGDQISSVPIGINSDWIMRKSLHQSLHNSLRQSILTLVSAHTSRVCQDSSAPTFKPIGLIALRPHPEPQYEVVEKIAQFIGNKFAPHTMPSHCVVDYDLYLGDEKQNQIELVTSRIPLSEIPDLNFTGMRAMDGFVALAKWRTRPVLFMSGVAAPYESFNTCDMRVLMRCLRHLKIKHVVFLSSFISTTETSNIGPGDIVGVDDHINFSGSNALTGHNDHRWGDRFPPMSEPYDRSLLNLASHCCDKLNIPVFKLVNVILQQCQRLHSRAELRMGGQLLAHVMTGLVVPDVVICRHMGISVSWFGIVTKKPVEHSDLGDYENAEQNLLSLGRSRLVSLVGELIWNKTDRSELDATLRRLLPEFCRT